MNKAEGFHEEQTQNHMQDYNDALQTDRSALLKPKEMPLNRVEKSIGLIRQKLDDLAGVIEETDRKHTLEMLATDPRRFDGSINYAAKVLFATVKNEAGKLDPAFWDFNILYDRLLDDKDSPLDPLEQAILKCARGIKN